MANGSSTSFSFCSAVVGQPLAELSFAGLATIARLGSARTIPSTRILKRFAKAMGTPLGISFESGWSSRRPEGVGRKDFRYFAGGVVGKKSKKKRNVARVALREAALKGRIRRHLKSLGFQKSRYGGFEVHGTDKDIIRSIHNHHRNGRVAANQRLDEQLPDLIQYFASGDEVDPARNRAGA